MDDAGLIKSLGWGECVRTADGYYCESHDGLWRTHATICNSVEDSLDHAEQGMALIRPVLTDLIAELRLTPRLVSHWNHMPALESPVLDAALDRAEARLREVDRR